MIPLDTHNVKTDCMGCMGCCPPAETEEAVTPQEPCVASIKVRPYGSYRVDHLASWDDLSIDLTDCHWQVSRDSRIWGADIADEIAEHLEGGQWVGFFHLEFDATKEEYALLRPILCQYAYQRQGKWVSLSPAKEPYSVIFAEKINPESIDLRATYRYGVVGAAEALDYTGPDICGYYVYIEYDRQKLIDHILAHGSRYGLVID